MSNADATPTTLNYATPGERVPGAVGRFLLSPVGWPLAVLAAVAAVVTLVAASGPVWDLGWTLVAMVGWIGVAGVWAGRAVGCAVAHGYFGRAYGGGRGRWGVVPIVFVGTAVVCGTGLPSRVAFEMSRPAMEAEARAALANPSGKPPPVGTWGLGLVRPDVEAGAVYFDVEGARFMSMEGYVYSPGGVPTFYGHATPIGGGWYRFSVSM